jgi:actin-like ATPase involved in cell morphogenesis
MTYKLLDQLKHSVSPEVYKQLKEEQMRELIEERQKAQAEAQKKKQEQEQTTKITIDKKQVQQEVQKLANEILKELNKCLK